MYRDHNVIARGTFDFDAWAGYLNLTRATRGRRTGDVARTIEGTATVNYDLDADGNLLGIEILPAHPEPGAIRDARYRGMAGESG